MSARQHPSYVQEAERLDYTKEYIETVVQSDEVNENKFRDNIKKGYQELNSLDSSQGYIDILKYTRFLEMTERNLRQLAMVRTKPYFSRIDFRAEGSDSVANLYIGKTSLFRDDNFEPVIVDWRSPIANAYYEGQLGEVTYETPSGPVSGEVLLKRQYTIENGDLVDIRDIDLTTRDELLQESLSTSADLRLKDIVSTIQAEQNRVIRAEMDRPLIVQGVAGSGKTTIALHRIAYFIYTYAEKFNPDQFMILAPNRLFLTYISEVLPELGVDQVKQTTFIDFVLECINKKLKLTDSDNKLLTLINPNREEGEHPHDLLVGMSQFKGSMAYKQMIDDYLDEILSRYLPNRDFKLGKWVIYSADEIKKFIMVDYAYLPLYKRIDKVKAILTGQLKLKSKQMQEEIQKFYDEKLDRAFTIQEPEKRRKQVVHYMDTKADLIKRLESDTRTLVKRYLEQFPKQNLIQHYQEIIADEERFLRLKPEDVSEDLAHYICKQSAQYLSKKQVELEDLAALLYLQHHLFGIDQLKIKNVVIDEAQDFSVFQMMALKTALNSELFTILGDLSQGIHAYRGVQDWGAVMREVFPNGNCNYLTLKQSYRTTVEIMNLANQVIKQSEVHDLVLAEPVVRHGGKPHVLTFDQRDGFIEPLLEQVAEIRSQGLKTIAVIGKSLEECRKIQRYLDEHDHGLDVALADREIDLSKPDIVIVPSYIAKGLEFDAVFILTLDDTYNLADLDVKLLYVAMTRPLHKLYVYSYERDIPLFAAIDPDCYERV